MKKLRVILPAILTLAVSTSAAVTGTVAWFTATRLRTVEMNKITVVNPEEGLNLVKVENKANTKLTGVKADGSLETDQTTPTITHAHDGTSQGYLRDASIDLSKATPVVYKAKLGDDGTHSGYEIQPIGTADTKQFDGKKIYYATQFDLSFNIDREDNVVDTCLFFDVKASSTKALAAVKDGDNTNEVYKALRIGFKAGEEWFVWAPLTGDTADATDESSDPKVYAPRYVTGTALANVADLDKTKNVIIGEQEPGTTDAKYTESGDKNAIAASNKNNVEYLGVLPEKDDVLKVSVYTWFEGTDTACVNANFQSAVETMEATLKFISRRVEK